MYYKPTNDEQYFSREGTFAYTDQNLEAVLDYLEDMILMTGCSQCGSLNTRLIIMDSSRLLLCQTCGNAEELPPPS